VTFLDSELIPIEEESVEHILSRLMQADGDIAMKTELNRPLNIVKLQTLANWLKEEKMLTTAKLIDQFVKDYMLDMVSNGRQGRKEIVRALQERLKDEAHGEARSRWTGKQQQIPED